MNKIFFLGALFFSFSSGAHIPNCEKVTTEIAFQAIKAQFGEKAPRTTVTLHDVLRYPESDFSYNSVIVSGSGYVGEFLQTDDIRNYSVIVRYKNGSCDAAGTEVILNLSK